MSESLARAGYEVTVVAPHSKDEVVDGVRIKGVPELKGRPSRMTLTVWRVYREALRQKADVYHFHDPELIPVGLLLRLQGKKVIYDIREDLPSAVLYKHYLPRWLRRPVAWAVERVENLACPWFSALVPVTPAIAERFQALNGRTILVQNYALRQEFAPQAELAWSQRPCSVAYVGGIIRERGIREMVTAMDLLPDRLQARLKLMGPFAPVNLRDEVARLPGWKRVDALGAVDRAKVAEVLGSVRAGLLLYHPEANAVRAQPQKMFEYMSAGIPVIASHFPWWREIVEGAGCGLLVDPLNPGAIAQGIEYLLTHPQEAEAMGHRGREAVETRYNWESEEKNLLQLYEHLSKL